MQQWTRTVRTAPGQTLGQPAAQPNELPSALPSIGHRRTVAENTFSQASAEGELSPARRRPSKSSATDRNRARLLTEVSSRKRAQTVASEERGWWRLVDLHRRKRQHFVGHIASRSVRTSVPALATDSAGGRSTSPSAALYGSQRRRSTARCAAGRATRCAHDHGERYRHSAEQQ
jgi:hypothetical protein